ncbi:MAG: adenylosuccinate lyase [Coriobacteriales bacterium]|jgi:adenylosuccinate lyase|nr:adenylosuccinate lyase [Coriobacteriales bacterium]
MIERYARDEMTRIFSLENKYAIWQEIEVLACEATAQLGGFGISVEEAAQIRKYAAFDSKEIARLEEVTNHDVIAFLTNLAQHVDAGVAGANESAGADTADAGEAGGSAGADTADAGGTHDSAAASVDDRGSADTADERLPKLSRWLHYGMTSSDLGDTALSYQITQALDLILAAVRTLGARCKRRAFEYKDTLCVGRTHGIHAEPMVFGMKFGAWAWALKRAEQRLVTARELSAARGAISGAVGSYSSIDPRVEAFVCEHLGLTCDPLSTQIIARDNHAHVAVALAGCAATLEQIATEVRALQKTDTLEAEEPFTQGQKGSSAMPHKRNPITCERICGLARVIKANAQVALDNVALWHERDISHSSAERVALTDSFIALDYILAKTQWVVDGLQVYPQNCRANLERTRGLIYSSKVLLALVTSGLRREHAYEIVQRNAMIVWQDIQAARLGPDFKELLMRDKDVAALLGDKNKTLDAESLGALFDPWNFLGNISVLFDRLRELDFSNSY